MKITNINHPCYQCACIDCILEAEVQHDMMLYKYLNQIRERKMLVNTFFFPPGIGIRPTIQ